MSEMFSNPYVQAALAAGITWYAVKNTRLLDRYEWATPEIVAVAVGLGYLGMKEGWFAPTMSSGSSRLAESGQSATLSINPRAQF